MNDMDMLIAGGTIAPQAPNYSSVANKTWEKSQDDEPEDDVLTHSTHHHCGMLLIVVNDCHVNRMVTHHYYVHVKRMTVNVH
jgi:hypothetical protein